MAEQKNNAGTHQHSQRLPGKRLSNRRTTPEQGYEIRQRFRLARELNGLNGVEAARLLGYANSTQLSQIERGERPLPGSWGFVVKAAQAYGVSADYLLGLSPHVERDPCLAQQFATMRSFKTLFEEHAATMTTVLMRHCIRSDFSHQEVGDFCARVRALIQSLRAMIALNPGMDFEGKVRGGATIFAAIAELESVHLPRAESFAKRKLDSETHLRQLALGKVGPAAYLMEACQQELEF